MTTNCKTPGLRIEWRVSKFGNHLYATVLHDATGLAVRRFSSGEILGGKRRFAAKVDSALGQFDWTVTAEQLTANAETLRTAAYGIPYDCR